MYIDIRLLENNGDETGFGSSTRILSKFIAQTTFDQMVKMLHEGGN